MTTKKQDIARIKAAHTARRAKIKLRNQAVWKKLEEKEGR